MAQANLARAFALAFAACAEHVLGLPTSVMDEAGAAPLLPVEGVTLFPGSAAQRIRLRLNVKTTF